MSKRFSVVQAKEVPGRDKPVWLRHGIAFENDKGISIKLGSEERRVGKECRCRWWPE